MFVPYIPNREDDDSSWRRRNEEEERERRRLAIIAEQKRRRERYRNLKYQRIQMIKRKSINYNLPELTNAVKLIKDFRKFKKLELSKKEKEYDENLKQHTDLVLKLIKLLDEAPSDIRYKLDSNNLKIKGKIINHPKFKDTRFSELVFLDEQGFGIDEFKHYDKTLADLKSKLSERDEFIKKLTLDLENEEKSLNELKPARVKRILGLFPNFKLKKKSLRKYENEKIEKLKRIKEIDEKIKDVKSGIKFINGRYSLLSNVSKDVKEHVISVHEIYDDICNKCKIIENTEHEIKAINSMSFVTYLNENKSEKVKNTLMPLLVYLNDNNIDKSFEYEFNVQAYNANIGKTEYFYIEDYVDFGEYKDEMIELLCGIEEGELNQFFLTHGNEDENN